VYGSARGADHVYAGTGAGLYSSYDKGENWVSINDGIPSAGVLYVGVIDSFMYAGTFADGLWKKNYKYEVKNWNSSLIDTKINSSIKVTNLESNTSTYNIGINIFPNPIEGEIKISRDEFSEEQYSIEIFNIAGVLFYKRQGILPLEINLEELNYHGFCIFKITDSKGKLKAVEKIMML
jgi:hypothetical protein